jgi:hypothetical protein
MKSKLISSIWKYTAPPLFIILACDTYWDSNFMKLGLAIKLNRAQLPF